MSIEYRTGDIFTEAEHFTSSGLPDHGVVIAHIVNNIGAFGKGFAAAITKRYPHVRSHYLANFSWCHLGDVLVGDAYGAGRVVVANLFAQDGLPTKENRQPLRYTALRDALTELAMTLDEVSDGYQVWMPKIGTGYGGGDWTLIEQIIKETLVAQGIDVVVFVLP